MCACESVFVRQLKRSANEVAVNPFIGLLLARERAQARVHMDFLFILKRAKFHCKERVSIYIRNSIRSDFFCVSFAFIMYGMCIYFL